MASPDAASSGDPAFYDEDDMGMDQLQGEQAKASTSQGQGPGNNTSKNPAVNDEEVDSELNEEEPPSFPVNMQITVSKPGKGALQIIASAHDGTIVAENIAYFPKT